MAQRISGRTGAGTGYLLSADVAAQSPTVSPCVPRFGSGWHPSPRAKSKRGVGDFCAAFRTPNGSKKEARKRAKHAGFRSEPRGRKSCWIKAGGRFGVPCRATSPRNAGRGRFPWVVAFCDFSCDRWSYQSVNSQKPPFQAVFMGERYRWF